MVGRYVKRTDCLADQCRITDPSQEDMDGLMNGMSAEFTTVATFTN